MMCVLSPDDLSARFQGDIDSIATNLIETFSLKFKRDIPRLSNPLIRWLDFRLRYVDPQPRQIVFSNKFPKNGLPADAKSALKKLCNLIQKGGDINPYQGRGLTFKNDSSGERREARSDLLWAEWDIFHFHLSDAPIPRGQYHSAPADYQAFCLIGGDLVAFIDVLRHPNFEGFSNPSLIQTVASNWPGYMAQYKINGILGKGENLTQTEIHARRVGGVASFLKLGGTAYANPGMGVTTASTPARVTLANNQVRRSAYALARAVCDPNGSYRTEAINALSAKPDYSLEATSKGLAVCEFHTKRTFLLPQAAPYHASTEMEEFHNLVLPSWACGSLVSRISQ